MAGGSEDRGKPGGLRLGATGPTSGERQPLPMYHKQGGVKASLEYFGAPGKGGRELATTSAKFERSILESVVPDSL